METKSIANKQGATVEEKVFLVTEYIKEKKDVEIDIDLRDNIFTPGDQLHKLNQAFVYARNHYLNK